MKFKKTHKNDRQTYKYRFSHTGDDGRYIDEVIELKAGENGVTEMDILKLHRYDDLDNYYYYKSARPERTPVEKAKVEEWKASFVSDFEKEHGYMPDSDYYEKLIESFNQNWRTSKTKSS